MTSAERIRILRERAGLSQNDLAVKLDLSRSSISMYETGERIPSTYVYQSMADLFNVDLDYIMGRSDKITVLPERLDYENRISKNTNRVLASMRRLNDDGQGRVADYAEDLCATERYKRPEREISHVIDFIAEPQALYTLGTAAAGSGFYNEDYIENYRLIMTTEIPEHDFTLDVEGNSMFPAILDGDVVFVRKEFDRIDNKIYVLDIDGETVVKRVIFEDDKIILRSDNPEWDDREVTGYALEHTRIEGIVVGWETPE